MMRQILHLFEGYGIEIEYMIVDKTNLTVRPIADEVLRSVAGEIVSDVEDGQLEWSNELVLHVIELKGNGPVKDLEAFDSEVHRGVTRINAILDGMNAMLMPTAMHPLMVPSRDTRLWPHDNREIYDAYNRIFNCQGHGWSNLQSMHINLPFANDDEFGRLHAAIRLILPILPALAASSPLVEGSSTGFKDNRLIFYQQNQTSVPIIAGDVIPEPAFSQIEYETQILKRIYASIADHDPDRILQEDWLNSRGAIARWGRQTIEIRLLDTQECPAADLAIASLVVATLKKLVSESWISYEEQMKWSVSSLKSILDSCIERAEGALIPTDFARIFSPDAHHPIRASDLWTQVFNRLYAPATNSSSLHSRLEVMLQQGTLATRISRALERGESIETVYRALSKCLATNTLYLPD